MVYLGTESGRLDKDSCGLLLLTNSGALVNEIGHPRNQVEKEYIVHSKNPLTRIDLKEIRQGVIDEDEILKVKDIQSIDKYDDKFRIILIEGKKRHIRRIFRGLRNRVVFLQRVREGEYELGDLKEGDFKIIK